MSVVCKFNLKTGIAMAKISLKAQQMPASAIRKLVPLSDAAKKQGTKVYHLNMGQPDIKSPECALKAVRENTLTHISYSNSAGLEELRTGLIEKYYKKIGIDISHLAVALIKQRMTSAFHDCEFEISGTPKDVESARYLAESNGLEGRYQFQYWALSLVDAIPANDKKKGADSGSDGFIWAYNDPNATNLALKNAPPSAEYPLGCDQMGRCELSRLLYGARYSMGLTIPVLIVLAAFALFVGCYSSYKGGLLDEVMRILCDILMAFPLIVIAMALVSAVDNSVASVIIAIGISMLAWFLRMVRSYAKTECGSFRLQCVQAI